MAAAAWSGSARTDASDTSPIPCSRSASTQIRTISPRMSSSGSDNIAYVYSASAVRLAKPGIRLGFVNSADLIAAPANALEEEFLRPELAIEFGQSRRLRSFGMGLRRQTVGIIGFGRIGERLARLLVDDDSGPRVAMVLARPAAVGRAASVCGENSATSDLNTFVACRPDVAVECASPGTLQQVAPRLLAAGIDVIPLSLTAFADREAESLLVASAVAGPGRIEIPPGAIGTLDLLSAARDAGLERVVYRQCKSIEMWMRTPAAELTDLSKITSRTTFLSGTAREVSARFPNNLNVSVGVSLAGLGLDRTEVELIADPDARETSHELDIDAPPGSTQLRIGGRKVAPDGDPVDYSTFSLLRLLRRRQASILL